MFLNQSKSLDAAAVPQQTLQKQAAQNKKQIQPIDLLSGLGACSLTMLWATSVFRMSGRAGVSLRDPIPFEVKPLRLVGCSPESTEQIKATNSYISQNIEEVFEYSEAYLDKASAKKLSQCFEKEDQSCATYVCIEDDDQTCNDKFGFYILSSSEYDNIYLCLNNIRKFNEQSKQPSMIAYLAEVIAHEVAHRCDAPYDEATHDGTVLDPVYRFGAAARTVVRQFLEKASLDILGGVKAIPGFHGPKRDQVVMDYFLNTSHPDDPKHLYDYFTSEASHEHRFEELYQILKEANLFQVRYAAEMALVANCLDEDTKDKETRKTMAVLSERCAEFGLLFDYN